MIIYTCLFRVQEFFNPVLERGSNLAQRVRNAFSDCFNASRARGRQLVRSEPFRNIAVPVIGAIFLEVNFVPSIAINVAALASTIRFGSHVTLPILTITNLFGTSLVPIFTTTLATFEVTRQLIIPDVVRSNFWQQRVAANAFYSGANQFTNDLSRVANRYLSIIHLRQPPAEGYQVPMESAGDLSREFWQGRYLPIEPLRQSLQATEVAAAASAQAQVAEQLQAIPEMMPVDSVLLRNCANDAIPFIQQWFNRLIASQAFQMRMRLQQQLPFPFIQEDAPHFDQMEAPRLPISQAPALSELPIGLLEEAGNEPLAADVGIGPASPVLAPVPAPSLLPPPSSQSAPLQPWNQLLILLRQRCSQAAIATLNHRKVEFEATEVGKQIVSSNYADSYNRFAKDLIHVIAQMVSHSNPVSGAAPPMSLAPQPAQAPSTFGGLLKAVRNGAYAPQETAESRKTKEIIQNHEMIAISALSAMITTSILALYLQSFPALIVCAGALGIGHLVISYASEVKDSLEQDSIFSFATRLLLSAPGQGIGEKLLKNVFLINYIFNQSIFENQLRNAFDYLISKVGTNEEGQIDSKNILKFLIHREKILTALAGTAIGAFVIAFTAWDLGRLSTPVFGVIGLILQQALSFLLNARQLFVRPTASDCLNAGAFALRHRLIFSQDIAKEMPVPSYLPGDLPAAVAAEPSAENS